MRVDLLSLHGLGPGTNPGTLAEWRVGAILEAIAVRDAKSGQLWLDIGGQRHPARLASSDRGNPADGAKPPPRVLPDALRRFVPRQQSPAPLLANLAWIAGGKNGTETLPKAVMHAAAQLWHALPDVDDLLDP